MGTVGPEDGGVAVNDTESLRDLQSRVNALEAEQKILSRLYQYGHSLDYGLVDDWLDCFTNDATFELHFAGAVDRQMFPGRGGTVTQSGLKYSGRDALRSFVSSHSHAPEAFHKHLTLLPTIEVRDSDATAVSYSVRLDVATDGVIYIRGYGRYLDSLQLCDDGIWRIGNRVNEIEAIDLRPFSNRAEVK
jgi:hypothetical protein